MDLETLKEEVRARADIVDIVGRMVKLNRSGSGAWKGLCPFHHEKTPSFQVDSKRQAYHCFGCGAGGDVFKFVMETEHLDFMGALEKLANQTGVEFSFDGGSGNRDLKKRQLELHEKACAFFEENLSHPDQGRVARDYIAGRELAADTPERFRFGYAPDSFTALFTAAREWGFSDGELVASGLCIERDRPGKGEGYFDRFRNRLMFPILDEQSRVIGFSGRTLPPNEAKAKYLNSPETLLFKKSRVLYGIDKARKAMTDARRALLCEGQLDVIRCHESGLEEAVAAQGTAVTETHAQILKRYADEVVLVLDADEAGVKAALRSADVLLAAGLSVRVVSLPEDGDPDDIVRKHGCEKLRELVQNSESFVTFQVRTLVRRQGDINETSRLRVAREVMQTILRVPEAIHRDELIRQAARTLGMREETLRQDVQAAATLQSTPPAPRATASARPSASRTPVASTPAADRIPPGEPLILQILMQYPETFTAVRPHLSPEHFQHRPYAEALEALYTVKDPSPETLLDLYRDHPLGEKLLEILNRNPPRIDPEIGTPEQAAKELVLLIRRGSLARKRAELQGQLRECATKDERTELETHIWSLSMHERKLKEFGTLQQWDKGLLLLNMMDEQN